MLKLLLRRSGAKNVKPTVSKPAAAGELAQGELWLNNNHETPALFARADDDTLIEWKPGAGGVFTGPVAPAAPANGMLWVDTATDPPVLRLWDSTPSPGAWSEVGVKNTPPTATSLTVTDVAGGNRFTSVAFPVALAMGNDGTPLSTKKLKAWVAGTLNVPTSTGVIVSTAVKAGSPTTKASVIWSDDLTPVSGAGAMIDGNLGTQYIYQGQSRGNRHPVVLFDQPILISKVRLAGTGDTFSPNASPGLWLEFFMPDGTNQNGGQMYPNDHAMPYVFKGYYLHDDGALATPVVAQGIGATVESGSPRSVGMAAFEINGVTVASTFALTGLATTVVTFASAADIAGFPEGTTVTGSKSGVKGVVTGISGTTLTIAMTGTGALQNGEVLNGPPKSTANAKLYCKLSAVGAVTDMSSTDPGFTAWSPAGSNPYTGTLTFPATLGTGNAPDADIPAGATLTASVEASNAAGTVTITSTPITPA